jgi:hypothetical protein
MHELVAGEMPETSAISENSCSGLTGVFVEWERRSQLFCRGLGVFEPILVDLQRGNFRI